MEVMWTFRRTSVGRPPMVIRAFQSECFDWDSLGNERSFHSFAKKMGIEKANITGFVASTSDSYLWAEKKILWKGAAFQLPVGTPFTSLDHAVTADSNALGKTPFGKVALPVLRHWIEQICKIPVDWPQSRIFAIGKYGPRYTPYHCDESGDMVFYRQVRGSSIFMFGSSRIVAYAQQMLETNGADSKRRLDELEDKYKDELMIHHLKVGEALFILPFHGHSVFTPPGDSWAVAVEVAFKRDGSFPKPELTRMEAAQRKLDCFEEMHLGKCRGADGRVGGKGRGSTDFKTALI